MDEAIELRIRELLEALANGQSIGEFLRIKQQETTQQLPVFAVHASVVFSSGKLLAIPLGNIPKLSGILARDIADCTPDCECSSCNFRTRVALGLRRYWVHLPVEDGKALYAEEATEENLTKALDVMQRRFKEEFDRAVKLGTPMYDKNGNLININEVSTLLEEDRGQDMPVAQAQKSSVVVTKTVEKKFNDVMIQRSGDKIILPDGMSYEEGREWLTIREQEEEQVVAINEDVNVFPLEGAYAFAKALDKKFGFFAKVGTPTWWGEAPPVLIGLEVALGKTEQVPWGRIKIPGLDGFLQTSMGWTSGLNPRPLFAIHGEVKQRHKALVQEIAELTRQIARDESIYKGQAFTMHFPDTEEGEEWSPQTAPKFMDLSAVNPEELIFPKETEELVQYAVFTPIRKTQVCRDNKIPLKRGILLEGPPGCGKTLTAGVTAQLCIKHGWTYIYIDNVKDLAQAIHFARQYQPAVIFGEDIDREVHGDRDEEIDKVLNTLDGVDTKSSELMVILTTNHVERITTEALRPGRLDTVIPVKQPDGQAVERLVRLYARGLLPAGSDLHKVGEALKGQIPAVIREVVERSKLASAARVNEGEVLHLEPHDLITTAKGMLEHLNLLNKKSDTETSTITKLGNALGEAAVTAVKEAFAEHRPNGHSKHSIEASA